MICRLSDPGLASLLARDSETVPEGRHAFLVLCALAFQVLALLAAGAFPW